jgi:hypothetical protein
MKPSIGRIVHYVAPGSADGTYPPAHRAAVITEVDSTGLVSLMVFNPTGAHWVQELAYDEGGTPFTWHWPEREGD